LAACILLLGAGPSAHASASPDPTQRCAAAAQPVEIYDALSKDPDAPLDDAIAAALGASEAFRKCAVFASVRGNVEDLHFMQVSAAHYRYEAGRLSFASGDYSQARVQLNGARDLVAETIAWQRPAMPDQPAQSAQERQSIYRASGVAVRDAANALLAKIPVPTGVSTAPATTPATGAPK